MSTLNHIPLRYVHIDTLNCHHYTVYLSDLCKDTLKRHHYTIYLSDLCKQTHLIVMIISLSLRSVHTDTLKRHHYTVYLSDLSLQTHLNAIIIPYISQTPSPEYLLPCCCICEFLECGMQHDHVLKVDFYNC